MVTIKDINSESEWSKKLHQVADKYGVKISARNGQCYFYLADTDDDNLINYDFKRNEEVFVFNGIYQMDNINEDELPKILEYQSDFIEVIKIIYNAEIKKANEV